MNLRVLTQQTSAEFFQMLFDNKAAPVRMKDSSYVELELCVWVTCDGSLGAVFFSPGKQICGSLMLCTQVLKHVSQKDRTK